MSINTGQMIGDYEVVDLIESSKTGTIYKVRNVLLQRFEASARYAADVSRRPRESDPVSARGQAACPDAPSQHRVTFITPRSWMASW